MRYILSVILSLFLSLATFAQIPSGFIDSQFKGYKIIESERQGIEIQNTNCKVSNDSLIIDFDLFLQDGVLKKGEGLYVLPCYKIGNEEVKLPTVVINGKRREAFYNRKNALMSHEEYLKTRPLIHKVKVNSNDELISYHFVYDLKQMNSRASSSDGEIVVNQFIKDCCDLAYLKTDEIPVKQNIIPEAPKPVFPALFQKNITLFKPEAEKIKARKETINVRINYPSAKYEVLPDFGNNQNELAKVDRLLSPLSQNKERYKLGVMEIRGYASPEGTYEYNTRLTKNRANGFLKYIKSKYNLSAVKSFNAEGKSEDWEGLIALIEGGDMPNKEEVLDIIHSVGLFDGRERQLMDLAGGKPYNYMFKQYYPSLRRIEMEMNYEVSAVNEIDAFEVIKDRPQDLSQEEIFKVAIHNNNDESINENRENYGGEFLLAAKYFENEPIALVNASSAELIRGNYEQAWAYLSKTINNPLAYNNIALYYWSQDKMDLAEIYFNKAIALSQEEVPSNVDVNEIIVTAKQNLSQMKIALGEIE